MPVPPTLDLPALLAEDRWMRRLARGLTRDVHAAEDLVQEAWIAALDPRARPERRRPWLRGVLRRLWTDRGTSGRARAAREAASAPRETPAPTDEIVAELELRKHLAEALLALEEPYRTAVTLRFHQDQPLGAIARRQGISVTRAHERVQEGLARLRARLDRAHGGRREAWSAALLGLARPAGVLEAVAETLTMLSAWKVAVGAAGVVGGLAWWLADPRSAPRSEAATAVLSAPAEAALGLAPEEVVASAPPARTVVAEAAQASAPAAPPAETLTALFHGRVVDPFGGPVASVAVGWRGAAEPPPPARSGADGSFSLPLCEGDRVECLEPDLVTLVPARDAALWRAASEILVVAPRAAAAGIVVDPEGLPVPEAEVAFHLRDALYRGLGLPRGEGNEPAWSTRTDASGAFALEEIAGGPRVGLTVQAPGFLIERVDVPPTGVRDLVIQLERGHAGWILRGVVVDPGGRPVEGARVSAGEDIVRTGADGVFEVRLFNGPGTFNRTEEGTYVEEELAPDARLTALAPGYGPATRLLAELDRDDPSEIVLRLAPEAATLSGRVVDPDGRPEAGAVVWLRDPTPFGTEIQSRSEEFSVAWRQVVEDELAGGFAKRGVRTDDQGRFTLTGLLPRAYRLCVHRPESGDLGGPFPVAAPAVNVELVLPREEPRGLVAGRLTSLDGGPIAGVRVRLRRAFEEVDAFDTYAEPPVLGERSVETDADGRFSLGERALAGSELWLQDPRLLVRRVRLADHADPADLELVEPLLCELQVDLSAEPGLADTVRVLDGDGEVLQTMETMGNGWTMDTEASLVNGLSPLLYVRETASTLVLLRGEREVLRRPLSLDPDARTTVRP